jgi:alpha-beta hydrolase superfamily lysophospholipase
MKYSEFYLNNSKNFRFFVREYLPDSTPKGLILLLHGLSDNGGRFTLVAESFVKEGFIFFAPDLRGNGKSDGKRGHFDNLDQMMADIKFLLEDCKKKHPGIPVMLYSQSMGGNLAINYALRFPDEIKSVVASSPWLRLTRPPSAPVQWAASMLLKISPDFTIPNGLNANDLSHDKEISKAYVNNPLNHGKVSVSTFFNIKESGEWAIKNAATLKIPVLLMHGDADPITSYAASQEFHKNSNSFLTFLSFKGLFHELHNEPGEKEMIVGKAVGWVKSQLATG